MPFLPDGKTPDEYRAALTLTVNPITLKPYTPGEITALVDKAFPTPTSRPHEAPNITKLRLLVNRLPLSAEQITAAEIILDQLSVVTHGWEVKHAMQALRQIGIFDEKKDGKDVEEEIEDPPDKLAQKFDLKIQKAKHITEEFLEMYLLQLAKSADPSPQIAAQLVAFMDKKKALTKVIDLSGGDHLTEKQVKILMKLSPEERDDLLNDEDAPSDQSPLPDPSDLSDPPIDDEPI